MLYLETYKDLEGRTLMGAPQTASTTATTVAAVAWEQLHSPLLDLDIDIYSIGIRMI